MHPIWPKPALSQNPFKHQNKTVHEVIDLLASQMGQRALNICSDIRKYKESKGDLQDYDFPKFRYKPEPTESNVCAKILTKRMKAFKCHDCIFENNSILCVECFEHSDHQGHVYEVIEVHGGCCDCGDQQKWDPKGFCKFHSNKNLVNDMRRRVNQKEERDFIYDFSFCFLYWFSLYNDCELFLMQGNALSSEEYLSKMKEVNHFGYSLLQHLSKFNKNSLISNIMTFNLLTSRIEIEHFELIFCPQANKKPIYEIILHMTRLAQCAEEAVNLFTHLFTLRDFRRVLTISFFNLHHDIPDFSTSEFNHLSCQLLTSHKTITELVMKKEIPPLVYKPKRQKLKSFQELAHNFVRYYIDIEYLASLYKGSSEIYLNYHIESGQFPSLGYYKDLTYELEEAVNYYGIEQIRLARVIKILKVLNSSKQCLFTLEKAIQDLWKTFFEHYKKWNQDLFKDQTYQTASIRNIYLTHEITWAMTVFNYFQKLQEEQLSITEEQKVHRLIQILKLDQDQTSIQKVKEMIQVINNNIVFSGLCLGHPETMDRYYTFFSFTFKKSLATISSTLFLYKITVRILSLLNRKFNNSLGSIQKINFISDAFVFERPLKILERMFDGDQFKQDDENIFDRKKNMIRLTTFLHLVIQASETDIHQLILGAFFDFPLRKQKYETMLLKFYLEILKNYKKIPLKDYKKIVDEIIHNDTTFEKFLSTSTQIVIEHGKIGLKIQELQNEPLSKTEKQGSLTKIESELNPYYFKSLKNKLTNLNEQEISFKTPSSSNHFLFQILSDSFVDRLLKILSAYIDIIVIRGGKMKEKQTASLGLFAIEMIKIQKAMKYKPNQGTSSNIQNFFKALKQNKTALSIFTQEVMKIICTQFEEHHDEENESLQNLNKQAQQKVEQRKRKLQQKKQKMKAKFKQNQQKFQGAYAVELEKIRQEMTEETELKDENSIETTKSCIVCKQTNNKDKFNSDLMLMGFMQLSDIYEHFFKGKHRDAQNCHLAFKTCGHYIHQKCHQKINKNKDYSVCQLCKSTTNCLFPVSSSRLQNTEMTKQEIQSIQKTIYENLSLNYSLLFAMDDGLRQDCQNGFGEALTDKREFKQKLIESLTIDIIYSAIINKDNSNGFFNKKQFEIYKNILHGLRIFCKGEENEIKKQKSHSKRQQMEAERQKIKMNTIVLESKILASKMKSEPNKQKQKVIEICYMMENYIRKNIINFIEDAKQIMSEQKEYLSRDCIDIIQKTILPLIGQNCEEEKFEEKNSVETESINYDYCPEIKLLREQIQFYSPPKQLHKLFQMRGKCPNCNLFTNHTIVCIICQWKGCKGCKGQSVFKHTALKHAGNSIYIEADLGNVFLVTKKKYWVYQSMYKDYLGESFKLYVNGMNLGKYSLCEQRWSNHVKKVILEYDIDTKIRYEEYNTKRAFTALI